MAVGEGNGCRRGRWLVLRVKMFIVSYFYYQMVTINSYIIDEIKLQNLANAKLHPNSY